MSVGDAARGLVDAHDLLSLTSELREARERIARARVSDVHRRRWRRRLAAIAEVAPGDLGDALGRVRRLTEDVERATRR